MTETILGKVMLTPKGEYDSTKSYTRLDVITYQGSSYVCLSASSTAPPDDSWQLLAKTGADGVTPHFDSTTGDWFIGSTDTGIKAQGPKGEKGDPGPQGEKGDPGSPGKDGHDGAPGKDGQTPTIGLSDDYRLTVNGVAIGQSLRGPQGTAGTDATVDTSKFATSAQLAATNSTASTALSTAQSASATASANAETLKGKADKSAIPDVSGFATQAAVQSNANSISKLSTQVSAIKVPDISGLATKDDLEKVKKESGKDLSQYIWTDEKYYNDDTSQGRLSYVAWSGYKQDLNEMRTPGFYFCWGNGDDGTKNKPDGATCTWGLCFVFDYNGSNHDTYQVYVDLSKYKVYNRDYETEWSGWVQVGGSNKVKTIDSGYDLSNYGDGRYEINYDAGDAPATGIHGILTVDEGKYWAKQTFTNVVENDDNHIGDTYVRMLVDGNWSDWRQTTAWN